MFYVLGQKATALTMKSMKGLKATWHRLGHGNRAFHFFYELAHGTARAFMSFMVDSLVMTPPMPFMVRSVQSNSSADRKFEVSTPGRNRTV